MKRKWIKKMCLVSVVSLIMSGCGSVSDNNTKTDTDKVANESDNSTIEIESKLEKIDMTKWSYNSDDNVYYQIGIMYCETPADENYETLSVFVPGDYMKGTDNGDGTYTCEINTSANINSYTAETAPIVMPINTPGYSAQDALTNYQSFTEYTSEGFVYVHAGCRGRDAGAPAGVTDLKAAIRYLRYSSEMIAADTERIFVFGMSGGGAQSAIVGATGDSDLYTPYLTAIGAVQGVSDSVLGSMDWCPITNLDSADEAYEWMMGSTRSGISDDEQKISDSLANAFADYINNAGIKDENGNVLTLEKSEEGIYQSGSYYDYMKSVIEKSLNNFLSDTEFPYDASSSNIIGGPDGMKGNRGKMKDFDGKEGEFQGPDGEDGTLEFKDMKKQDGNQIKDNISRTQTSGGISLSGTYETAEDYIDALNADGIWVKYDASTNTATITSISDFVKALKNTSKSLGAFDQLDAGQGENTLFGYGDGNGAHFDSTLAEILNDIESEYASNYKEDLQKKDSVGNTAEQRLNIYTPLYYLLESEEGYKTSTPAKYWRIRSGINQGDTALSTEMNLALALQNYEGVETVDFETVWGQGHTQAERTGSSTDNFINWVNECLK